MQVFAGDTPSRTPAAHSSAGTEHDYAMTPPEALRWAIDNHSPGWVSESEKTQASLMRYREALLTFHRESKRARYSKKKAAVSRHPRAL